MAIAPDVTRQTVASNNIISPVGAEIIHEVQGRHRAETVELTPETSKIAEEAEEVGMALASRADRRSLGQRDIRAGRGSSAQALANAKGYGDRLPDMPGEVHFEVLVDLLTRYQEAMAAGGGGDGGPTKEDVLDALGRFDGDVSHQFAALDTVRDHFEAEGADPGFLRLLDDANAEFDRADVIRDVRAGFAVAAVASREAATLETDPAAVRDSYRAMLRETPSMGQLFEAIGRFDPLKSMGQAIAVFTEAAGRDLASAGPSTEPAFLHSLLTELGKLKKMQTALDATDQLIQLTERSLPPSARGPRNTVEQAGRILAFASRASAGPADARQMLGRFEKAPLGIQLVYANGVRSLHGDIPDEVMPSPQARLQQNAAIRGLLDQLVEAEERQFASGSAA